MKKTTKIAIKAAELAGNYLKKKANQTHTIKIKDDKSFVDIVTESDYESEKIIINTILSHFPTHAILSEETSPDIDPKKYKELWIIDPLDGTIAFASGLPFYSVSIAYKEGEELLSSALYMAATGDILWAEKGRGAFRGKKRIHVKDTAWKYAVISLDPGNRYRTKALKEIAPLLSKDIRFLQITSGEAGNLGLVAQGSIQGLVCIYPSVWDYAAGMLLVQEAGGIMTDLQGKPYELFSSSGHIASSPKIHKNILKFTKKFSRF